MKGGGGAWSSVMTRLERREAKIGCQMEPVEGAGALRALYIGWGGERRADEG
jgi:hypothetical protein